MLSTSETILIITINLKIRQLVLRVCLYMYINYCFAHRTTRKFLVGEKFKLMHFSKVILLFPKWILLQWSESELDMGRFFGAQPSQADFPRLCHYQKYTPNFRIGNVTDIATQTCVFIRCGFPLLSNILFEHRFCSHYSAEIALLAHLF